MYNISLGITINDIDGTVLASHMITDNVHYD